MGILGLIIIIFIASRLFRGPYRRPFFGSGMFWHRRPPMGPRPHEPMGGPMGHGPMGHGPMGHGPGGHGPMGGGRH